MAKILTDEYLLLFNQITDTIQELDRLKSELIVAQQKAEELYISDQEGVDLCRESDRVEISA